MKSSFNEESGPREILDFVSQTLSNANNYQDAFEILALALLPVIREARISGDLDAKARNMPVLYDMMVDDIDFFSLSNTITSFPRSVLAEALKTMTSRAEMSPEERLRQATQTKSQILSLSEADYIALSTALDSVAPPQLKAAVNAADGGQDTAAAARETYRLAASLSPEDIAAALAERDKRLVPDDLVDGVHALFQQCTPERLEKFVSYMNDNVGGAVLGLLVKRFWEFSEEVLQAAEDGNFMRLNNPAKARSFGRSLCDTLTALEEGLQQAGFTVPEELSRYTAEAFNTPKVLRTAAAIKAGTEAHQGLTDGITVNRPIKYKNPGFRL